MAPLSLAPAPAPGTSEQRSWTVSPLEAGWSQAAVQAVCVGGIHFPFPCLHTPGQVGTPIFTAWGEGEGRGARAGTGKGDRWAAHGEAPWGLCPGRHRWRCPAGAPRMAAMAMKREAGNVGAPGGMGSPQKGWSAGPCLWLPKHMLSLPRLLGSSAPRSCWACEGGVRLGQAGRCGCGQAGLGAPPGPPDFQHRPSPGAVPWLQRSPLATLYPRSWGKQRPVVTTSW